MADNLTQDARFGQALSDQGPDAGERMPTQGLPQQLAQLQTRLDALQQASQERQQDQGMEILRWRTHARRSLWRMIATP